METHRRDAKSLPREGKKFPTPATRHFVGILYAKIALSYFLINYIMPCAFSLGLRLNITLELAYKFSLIRECYAF